MSDEMRKTSKGFRGPIGMEGFIARLYDKNARKYQIGVYHSFLQRIEKDLKNGDKVLEIAPGPGYLAIELSRMGDFTITGLDISKSFVEIAKKNAEDAGRKIVFEQGDAANLPYSNNSFNIIICTSAFKNFSDPVKALQEMYRVLKPNGIAYISDFRHDASNKAIDELTDNFMKVKGFSSFFMKWSFKSFLRKRAYTKEQFRAFISKTDFKSYRFQETPVELDVRLEKS
jgi:ubiquinone/menaquinone biosynthesis C-methylase UbiE